MGKTVPLVMYLNGQREVIGEAVVEAAEDDSLFVKAFVFTGQVDEERREITDIELNDSGSFSIQPKEW